MVWTRRVVAVLSVVMFFYGFLLGGILYPLLMGATVEHASLTVAMFVLAATAAAGGAFCCRLKKDI